MSDTTIPDTPASSRPLVEVEDLAVRFRTDHGIVDAVRGVSFTIEPGRCVALVGESGSGKSVSARALLGLNGAGARTTAARLRFDGQDLLRLRDREWRRIRGGRIGYVLQDALGSLDPLRTIGQELDEAVRLQDRTASRADRRDRSLDLLRRAHMPEPERRLAERSPQLSGGLRQRALIATALAGRPRLLVADEPTTALDVTVQSRILGLFRELRNDGFGLLFISHDLAAVSEVADDVLVLRDGEVVEHGPVDRVLTAPEHAYTQALLDAVPSRRAVAPRPDTADHEVLLSTHDLVRRFRTGPAGARVERTALDGVSVRVRRGTTLGVVGESGSGKTTLSRILAGIDTATSGTVQAALPDRAGAVQYVYQDPLASFDPRYTVERVLAEAVRVRHPRIDRATVSSRVVALLADVGLDASFRTRRPVQLSGGQRQRIAIARALAAEPELVVLDEPVSALDVSVQAQILDLLDGIQRASGITMVFVSHDLGVVRQVSDEVVVMRDGRVVESGPTGAVLVDPEHEYTRELIAAIPTIRSTT